MQLAVIAGKEASVVSPSVGDTGVTEMASGHPVHRLTQQEVL